MDNEIQNMLKNLKQIFEIPRLYIANYFIDLKSEIDLAFNKKLINDFNHEIKTKWLEIINRINLFEKDCLKKFKNLNDLEFKIRIQTIEDHINNGLEKDTIKSLIEQEEINLIKYLFLNQTITFIDNPKQTFLIIIKDEYLTKTNLLFLNNTQPFTLTNELLKVIVLKIKYQYGLSVKNVTEFSLNLNNMQELNLADSNICCILNDSFKDLNNLKELHLGWNNLSIINDNTFEHLLNLTKLNIQSNDLTRVNLNTFKGLINLKELDLSGNSIDSIQDFSFNHLDNLDRLDLSRNKLSHICINMFNGLFNLKNLILSDNPIESIEQDSFVELKHLEVLKYSKEQTEIFYDSDRKSKFFKV